MRVYLPEESNFLMLVNSLLLQKGSEGVKGATAPGPAGPH